MIVIPMLGRSSRFFTTGYPLPKYMLPLGGETVFAKSVKSFKKLFKNEHFLFLVRSDHEAQKFVTNEVVRLGIRDFRIIEFESETRGQAESVYLGTLDYSLNESFIIFNIDTIRLNFELPRAKEFADGFLEVFHGLGDAWSFVKPFPNSNSVQKTTEKLRISEFCSNGLYGFKSIDQFRRSYLNYIREGLNINGEVYIAPLYNYLISEGNDIRYHLIDSKAILHCGIPSDYESLKTELGP